MTVDPSDFRAAFPEFWDSSVFTNAQISFWAGEAANELTPRRMGNSLTVATYLFIAHNIVLGARAAAASAAGGIPGEATGPTSSKSVDKVSVSYDTASAAIEGAGAYNLTSYGQRLYRMIKAFSAGPIYVTGRSNAQASRW